MDKYITDERTGIKYELVRDYYLITGDDGPENRSSEYGDKGTCVI